MIKLSQRTVESPLGPLTIWGDDTGLTRLAWGVFGADDSTAALDEAALQLRDYFTASRPAFDLALSPPAKDFAAQFQRALCAIPFGDTRTYGDLADQLGVSAQAIGQACGANKIPIIVPCHRVVGAAGLGGYSGDGGVETKVWLLRHEGAAGLLI